MHVTIADYILELAQNAVESGADRIDLRIDQDPNQVAVTMADNGCGMDAERLRRCCDPYVTGPEKHPGRPVGLGLALLSQLLDTTGGRLSIDSESGRGTRVKAEFKTRHVDTPPLGDLDRLFFSAFTYCGDYDLHVERRRIGVCGEVRLDYRFSRRDIREMLGGLENVAALSALSRFLHEQEHGASDS